MSLDHGLYTVGNQFAAGQRILHANMTHGDTIVNTNGIELKGNAARSTDSFFDNLAKGLQMNMTGNDINIRITHRDKWLLEILFTHYTGCTQQTTMRSTLEAELDLI
ncbi:hypothetical protein KSX_54830 [Ktedonospora formicarum]|uniref:Uncharacterized protein n=1 Tax=Ktedonospora formicarum TaxID=2778364 RepID=A0A8J3MTN5_9CHLR|nr:hypothetical protein KSX_54830 [Ktedonospora formicarum]